MGGYSGESELTLARISHHATNNRRPFPYHVSVFVSCCHFCARLDGTWKGAAILGTRLSASRNRYHVSLPPRSTTYCSPSLRPPLLFIHVLELLEGLLLEDDCLAVVLQGNVAETVCLVRSLESGTKKVTKGTKSISDLGGQFLLSQTRIKLTWVDLIALITSNIFVPFPSAGPNLSACASSHSHTRLNGTLNLS